MSWLICVHLIDTTCSWKQTYRPLGLPLNCGDMRHHVMACAYWWWANIAYADIDIYDINTAYKWC